MNFDITSWDQNTIDIDRLINIPKGSSHIERKTKIADSTELYINDHAVQPEESCAADEVLHSTTTPINSETELLCSATTPLLSCTTTPVWYCTTILEPVSHIEEWEEEVDGNTLLNTIKYNKYTVYTIYFEEGIYYSLAKLLADSIPKQNSGTEEPDLQVWAYVIDNMITFDQRHPEEIKEIILFSQQDEFWSKIITNTKKLRFFYDNIKTKKILKNSFRYGNRKEEEREKYEIGFIS